MGCCLFDCIGGIILTIFRWGLIVANIFFLLAGISLVTIGSIIHMNTEDWRAFYSDESQIAAIVCLSAGCVTIVTACLGFYAVLKKKSILLFVFSGVIIASSACLLAGGILSFTYKPEFELVLRSNMLSSLNKYYLPGEEGTLAKESWDRLQKDYRCCGVTTYRNWMNGLSATIPASCNCELNSDGCIAVGTFNIFEQGCYTKMQPHTIEMVDALGGLAYSMAGFELIAGVAALLLAGSYKNKRKSSISS